MRHAAAIRVGPVSWRIGAAWRAPIDALRALYADYPPFADVADYTVRLEPARPWRRVLRPSIALRGDWTLPDAAPLPLAHGLLAAEMAMNLQLALGERRYLLLHAATVERDGRAVVLTGESGAGKSTLAALLMTRGWRLLGDEFALLDPGTGAIHPLPRPISLKNESIAIVAEAAPDARFGPVLSNTPKGNIRHIVPDAASLAAMDRPAMPAILLFPRYGFAADERGVGAGEAFVRLTQASTNYTALGARGFEALTRFVRTAPAVAVDYPDTCAGIAAVERLFGATT